MTTSCGTVEWVLKDAASGVEVKIVGTIVDGQFVLTYELVSGEADLNGLFIDYGNDGGSITSVGSKSNNMNGSDNEGDRLNGFDDAAALGTVGGNDADNTAGTVIFDIPSDWTGTDEELMMMLAEAEIGIRATSVGPDGEGSLKLADNGSYCPPEEETDDYPDAFPLSNATLIFSAGGNPALDTNGDGYVAVKIDSWDEGQIDFDDYEDAVLAKLAADYGLTEDDLLGVILKGGSGDTLFYAKGDDNPDADAFPMAPDSWAGTDADYWLNYPPPQGNIDAAVVDINYANTDAFLFV